LDYAGGEAPTMDGKIKAPPPAGRMWLLGLEIFDIQPIRPGGARAQKTCNLNAPSAIPGIGEGAASRDDAGR
jgi:hypothetical protein